MGYNGIPKPFMTGKFSVIVLSKGRSDFSFAHSSSRRTSGISIDPRSTLVILPTTKGSYRRGAEGQSVAETQEA